MSKLSINNELYSAAAGIYSTNSLFARFDSMSDLRIDEGDPSPGALPTHIHEYVHYLHNISTTSGIKIIQLSHAVICSASLFLIKGTDGIDTNINELSNGKDIKSFIDEMNYLYGETIEIDHWGSKKQNEWEFGELSTYTPNTKTDFFSYKIKIAKKSPKNVSVILKIGLNFITEGVAYEVEREVFKEGGGLQKDLDSQTPGLPYLAYEHLVNYIVRRETTAVERIKIGNTALMHPSPSQGFVDACRELSKGASELDLYNKKMIGFFKLFLESELFDVLQKYYSHTHKLLEPFKQYVSIIKSTSEKRVIHPHLELIFVGKNTTGKKMNPSCFLSLSSNIAEHCIIQEKIGSKATIHMVGNRTSLAAKDENEVTWFYVLCAAIHFIQQHLKTDGTVEKTDSIKKKNCPFSGACEVEISNGHPQECKEYPWRVTQKVENGACWYSAGVKSITPASVQNSQHKI
ncbi:hypothetical protein MASR2M32_05940 [Sphaerotilus sulfidivorans]